MEKDKAQWPLKIVINKFNYLKLKIFCMESYYKSVRKRK